MHINLRMYIIFVCIRTFCMIGIKESNCLCERCINQGSAGVKQNRLARVGATTLTLCNSCYISMSLHFFIINFLNIHGATLVHSNEYTTIVLNSTLCVHKLSYLLAPLIVIISCFIMLFVGVAGTNALWCHTILN